MSSRSHSDRIMVVNGPEDGTEFPIVRSPAVAGSDPGCAIHISMDPDVKGQHAEVSAASDCYKVRALTKTSHVYVNDKRAGAVRPATAVSGDIIRMGNTLLRVDCVPAGLAARSHGIAVNTSGLQSLLRSGVGAAGRLAARLAARLALMPLRLLKRIVLRFNVTTAVAAFVLLLIVWPSFRHTVFNFAIALFYRVMTLIRQ